MCQIILFSDCTGSLGVSRYAGPYRIATELRKYGYSVKVIDYFTSYSLETLEKILKIYVDKSTLFVGFSATLWVKYQTDEEIIKSLTSSDVSMRSFYSYNLWTELFPQPKSFINELFNMIHSLNQNCKIVVGGYKANNFYYEGIDYWVLGQGEGSAVAIANHLYKGDNLKGIKTNNGIILTDKIYPFNEFSSSKILFEKDDYLLENENVPIETARGCIFKCSFCSFNLNGKKFGDYTKNSDTFKEELIYNYENYGLTEYMISDDTFNDSIQKVEYFYNIIKSLPFKIKFSCHARLDIIGSNMEMAHMLQEMGLTCVEFGIETMNKETGKYIGKLGDRDKIIKILTDLKSIWKDDVYTSSGFIVGLPYETEESIRKTMEWLYEENNPLTAIQFNKYYHQTPNVLKLDNIDNNDLLNMGFFKTSNGWVYENFSKIFENPAKYGYKIISKNKWQNIHMDDELALKIEKEFHSSTKCRKKKNMSVFHNYNRIKNIGYSHDEIKNLYYDDLDFIKEALSRSKKIKNQYLNRLL